MTGTTAALGWELGFDDPLFALAAVLSFIVLYDASGVRRAAGLTAQRVNGLPDGLWDTQPQADDPAAAPLLRPLKENLGHTRPEVLVGSLIGPLVALPGLALLGTPWQIARQAGWLPLG
jgi:acid phosphatase family membrane protein YuiD